MAKVYGIRIRRAAGDPWIRGKAYRKKVVDGRERWFVKQSTWATKTAARLRLMQYRAQGFKGHVFEIKIADATERTWRERMRKNMVWAVEHEPQGHYRQYRPFNVDIIKNKQLPYDLDCSSMTVCQSRAVGRPDPTGNGYDAGKSKPTWTGTLRSATPKRAHVKDALVGDHIVYGQNGGAHVVQVFEPGPDPLVFSHGQEAGPMLVRHSTELRVHGTYFTVHDIGALK